jgi:hypothetical protein
MRYSLPAATFAAVAPENASEVPANIKKEILKEFIQSSLRDLVDQPNKEQVKSFLADNLIKMMM